MALLAAAVSRPGSLGNVGDRELLVIPSISRMIEHALCCEVGTYDGRTTRHPASNPARGPVGVPSRPFG